MKIQRGQTILEYAVIMIVIMAALLAMQSYIKRGIQGRWKSSVDEMGEQYDPNSVNSNIVYTTAGNSTSLAIVMPGTGPVPPSSGGSSQTASGQWTMRNDASNMVETKVGNTQIGN